MSLIQNGSTWVLTGGPTGELVSFGGLVTKVKITCVSGTGFWRCQRRKSSDAAATAPAATPLTAAGTLMPGWAAFAAKDQQTFGPPSEVGLQGYGELELWGTAAGGILVEFPNV